MPTSTAPQCFSKVLAESLYRLLCHLNEFTDCIESFPSCSSYSEYSSFLARLPRMVKMQTLDLEGNQIGEYLGGQSSLRTLSSYQVISTYFMRKKKFSYDFL